jgi:hypothetical protein
MSNIINLNEYLKHKKQMEADPVKNFKPQIKKLHINQRTGKVTASIDGKPFPSKPVDVEKQRQEQVKKITETIQRINTVMNELKIMAAYRQDVIKRPTILK